MNIVFHLEARGVDYGVVIKDISSQPWTHGLLMPYIDYTLATSQLVTVSGYDFIKDVQSILGSSQAGKATQALLDKTVTISTSTNKNHTLVTPLERQMKAFGYYTGTIEADSGKQPCFGAGMAQAIKQYQKEVVKATVTNQDGIVSKGGATWHKLLNI